MDKPDPTWPEVIVGYWRYMALARDRLRLPDQQDLTDIWAWEAVDSLFAEGVPAAIDKFVQLAEAVPDPELLTYLGGGPLEDLVTLWNGDYEDAIVAAARRSSNFVAALRAVYPTPPALALWARIASDASS